MPTATDSHDLVISLIEAGSAPNEVEEQLSERAPWLDAETVDAIWLFAWSYQGVGRARDDGPVRVPDSTYRIT